MNQVRHLMKSGRGACPQRRRGAVLIVVLGVLVVLSLLAVTFVQVATLDRTVASIYLDGIRAKLIARAGVERAVNDIVAGVSRGAYNDQAMMYWGDDADEKGSPKAGVPLELATNPSFAVENDDDPSDPNFRPKAFVIDGRTVGISGTLSGGTYSANGDVYRLKIMDANSMIHVNDGLEGGRQGNVSRNLLRILDRLGDLLGVQHLGGRVISDRPQGGYRSKKELEKVLGPDDYAKTRNFLTTAAWVDRNAINPVPLSSTVLKSYPVPYNQELGMYRYGRSMTAEGALIPNPMVWAPEYASPSGWEHAIMALDEVNAQWIERTRRAPVNVNLAPREILIALIADLQGWFITERRKSNPGLGLYYMLGYPHMENSPGGMRGDEYGYLYSTERFVAPGSAAGAEGGSSGVQAEKVADEIIACRMKQPSPGCPGIDYGRVWYGGPFKTWRQFNAFCDGLVVDPIPQSGPTGSLQSRPGLFHESRAGIYYDYMTSAGGTAVTGSDSLFASRIQPRWASQAIADVLKANFNPNVTLNELNPDANMHLLVDKTDLICNSTEFCFTPMGYYEIESEGLVIRTEEDGQDFMEVAEGTAVARKLITCVVKAFDVHRDTTQADFYAGTPGLRPGHSPVTNNNCTVELGPEPDNGPAPSECRWSGWMQLSTVGGHWKTVGEQKKQGSVERTPAGRSERGEVIHSHFGLDHDAHHHAMGEDARHVLLRNAQCRNNPDRTERLAGPYGPTSSGKAGKYRLARDWNRLEDSKQVEPELTAPGDLRVDGAYIERDSAVMWQNGPDVFGGSGTTAFWFKPSFHPGMTGKARTFFTVDTIDSGGSQKTCAVWFIAAQDSQAFTDSINEWKPPVYDPGPWRPSSLVFGWSSGWGGIGTWTPSLNHRSHGDYQKVDVMEKNAWIHVTAHWEADVATTLWVNGQLMRFSTDVNVHPSGSGIDEFFKNGNPVRIGESSQTWMATSAYSAINNRISRNWTPDSTVDEFYLWKGNRLSTGQDLYSLGRYYRPVEGYEAAYTSAELKLPAGERLLPPPSSTAAPPIASSDEAPTRRPGASHVGQAATALPQTRILAALWTMIPEFTRADGRPVVVDRHGFMDLPVVIELDFVVNGLQKHVNITGDGGPAGVPIVFGEADRVKYQMRVRLDNGSVDAILMGTPVIDDVTLFYTRGPEYLSYELNEISI